MFTKHFDSNKYVLPTTLTLVEYSELIKDFKKKFLIKITLLKVHVHVYEV